MNLMDWAEENKERDPVARGYFVICEIIGRLIDERNRLELELAARLCPKCGGMHGYVSLGTCSQPDGG